MKKNLLAGAVVAMGFALGTVSCGDESSLIEAGTGRISPRITIDGDIITASDEIAGSRANEDVVVTVSDLKLRLTSDDGSFSQEWESIDDFDENQEFKVGDYTLEAYYGNENDVEGYAKPHFHGSQDISVHYDRTTNVSMSASLKNSRVVIKYTDAFKDYMAAYSVRLLTPKGKYISVPGDEYSPVYVAPGKVSINLSFTKPDGEGATIEAATFEAKAKTEHVVTIDLNGGQDSGETVLKVTFDSTVESEDVEIDLDDLVNAPAPEITTEGWTSGQTLHVIENTLPSEPVKANIMARGKIAAVTLSTQSPSLKAAGWPEVVDLTDPATPQATIDLMTSLGLKMYGVRKNPDMMGVIDFTEVFANLSVSAGLTESSHQFALQAKDKYGKLSEVAEFTVVSSQGHIEIVSATAEIGHKTINAEVKYNGDHELADVTFQMRNNLGTWDELTLTNVQAIAGQTDNDKSYKVTLTSPTTIQSTHTLRAVYGSTHSDISLEVTTPSFVLHVSDNDVFAHHATVTIDCADADDAAVAGNISTITLTNHSTGKSRTYDNYTVEDADVIIAGLAAGTLYTVEIQTSSHSATAQFTTETEDHLPGCEDDENGTHSVGFATLTWTGSRMGGNNSNCLQYLWSTVEGWGTMNELTTSTHGTGTGSGAITGGCSYKATSGTIPANGRSTQSFANGGAGGTTKHSDGHTTGNNELHKNRQHGGTNAALIRTVGWGSKNSAAASFLGTPPVTDNAGFNVCEHMTQGELYLGKYENGPQYGYDFTSRPSALTFWYHYDPAKAGNGDYGTAEIHVYDAAGVEISKSEVLQLTEHANDRWTDLTKRMPYTSATIPITYDKGAKKAARISIIFRSTWPDQENNPALNSKNTNYWNTPGHNNTSGGEYVGSELYIDDVRLIY